MGMLRINPVSSAPFESSIAANVIIQRDDIFRKSLGTKLGFRTITPMKPVCTKIIGPGENLFNLVGIEVLNVDISTRVPSLDPQHQVGPSHFGLIASSSSVPIVSAVDMRCSIRNATHDSHGSEVVVFFLRIDDRIKEHGGIVVVLSVSSCNQWMLELSKFS